MPSCTEELSAGLGGRVGFWNRRKRFWNLQVEASSGGRMRPMCDVHPSCPCLGVLGYPGFVFDGGEDASCPYPRTASICPCTVLGRGAGPWISAEQALTSSSKLQKQKESLTYLTRLNGHKKNIHVVLNAVRAWNEGIKGVEGFPSSQRWFFQAF